MQINEILQVMPLFLNHSNAAVAIKDIDGYYLLANQAYCRYLGQSLDTITGQRDENLLASERCESIHANEKAAIDDFTGMSGIESFTLDGADLHYVTTRFPILDENRHRLGLGVVAMDVTEQHQGIDHARQALYDAEQVNVQLRQVLENMEQLASTDRLTGAWNRRRFEEAIEGEIHRFHRYGHPVSLLLLDIDHFKRVNDNYGHQEGDRVLKQVAETVFASIRKSDSLTRWGGEEFIVLMPNTGLSFAGVLSERIRAAIADQTIEPVGQVTVSIGVAEFHPTSNQEDWLDRADRAMYTAKRDGRNRVVMDPTLGPASARPEHFEGHFLQLMWKDSFLSRNHLIDAQHKNLFQVSNELLDAVLSGRPQDEISLIVAKLIADVAQHFKDEEIILGHLAFPGLTAHAEEHERLVAKALELVAAFEAGRLSVGNLFQFLAYDVVTRHMLGADREYFPYTQTASPDLAP
jgi:diguanylate cyclase (GGDEF)-like protein/hemerythrin-like metal-binding protein/PAS domain S-box-containing protein